MRSELDLPVNCTEWPIPASKIKGGGGGQTGNGGEGRLAAEKRRKGGEGLSKCPSATVKYNPVKRKKKSKPMLSHRGETRTGETEN